MDFKKIIRDTLEYSFLPGKSLWQNSDEYYIMLPQCNAIKDESSNCWEKETDKKAFLQYSLEEKLNSFESKLHQ